MTKEHRAYFLLGSNTGDRANQLEKARSLIERYIGRISAKSRIYETQPWGYAEQADFYNQALEVRTLLQPKQILEVMKRIESEAGRTTGEKWGPRLLDVDLLLYDNMVINAPDLTVPHPRLQERNFALVPLMELASELRHPVLNLTIEELYWDSKDEMEVVLVD